MGNKQEANRYNLHFISDENLFNHTKETILSYRFKINLAEFYKNIIDPIKLTFDHKVYKKDFQELINEEIMRQIDKSNNNTIGYFHQNIFKYIGDGWSVPKEGFDVENKTENIFVEMKNKHNTMNSSSSQRTYIKMQHKLNTNPQAQCFLVEVIAKTSQNIPWVISIDKEQIVNERIRRISIDKFYEIVTGDKFAFRDLCKALPVVMDDVLKTVDLKLAENSVFDELKELSPNISKSIYLLAFSKYEGFDSF